MHRKPQSGALQLPLVEEAQAGAEEGDNGGRPVLLWGEGGCRSGLVVILEETGRVLLEAEVGPQMVPTWGTYPSTSRSYSLLS